MSYVQTEMAVFRYGDQLNVPYTNSTMADIAAGDVIDMGTFVAVALEFIKIGEKKSLCWRGVFEFLKQADEQIDVGNIVLWDATNHRAYVSGGGYSDDACIGKCAEASATTDLTVLVSMIETASTVAG